MRLAAGEVLLTDTVGFIQKLPTQLVAAFRRVLGDARDCLLGGKAGEWAHAVKYWTQRQSG